MSAPQAWTSPEQAAQLLFHDPRTAVDFVPENEKEAARAVEELRRLFESAPGVFKEALDGARAGAETLSHDQLQGLAEIIQNADDAGATFVEFSVFDGYLIAQHDGVPLTLSDVLSLSTPWLSNKSRDASATGRYGIGLMTLRVLSDVLEVHSAPYRLRLGDPTISALEAAALPGDLIAAATTVMCVPLQRGSVVIESICEWIDRWDHAALLFLRSVRRVGVADADGASMRALSLDWSDGPATTSVIGGTDVQVARRHAEASDGRKWLVHTAEVPKPERLSRVRKASNPTVPLGLALPLHPGDEGAVYAGLPLVRAAIPLRINAQFDPITSRTGMASTDWNRAMVPLLADLWVEAVQDLFSESPRYAWDAVPLPDDEAIDSMTSVVALLEASILGQGREHLPGRIVLPINGAMVLLTRTAVEEEPLTSVLTGTEIAALAQMDGTLPPEHRDPAGRWRAVLDDWRNANGGVPPEVTVSDALVLLADADRSNAATIALTAACIGAGFSRELRNQPCVVSAHGDRILPPSRASLRGLIVGQSPLAENLGLAIRLHEDHLGDGDAPATVVTWLREIGAVLDDADDESVVRRLSQAGSAGDQLDEALSDAQLRALRNAMEPMPSHLRAELGPGVGMAIRISAYRFTSRGQREELSARPADVYLPRAIDKEPESFALAAAKTPGLLWAHARYADQLRSSIGRSGGLGPQKFLGLLGAERGPRTIRHPALVARYADSRLGLPARVSGSPAERSKALAALGASYTLDDLDSPDLRAIVTNIARERKVTLRRQRAVALLGALSRQWDRLEESAEVVAAEDYYEWRRKGTVPSFWAWSVGSIEWLDDTGGNAMAPLELRLRTQSTIAVHGSDAAGYLRPDYEQVARREVLTTLGVTGEPSTADLVDRLRDLRSADPASDSVDIDATIVYQALAERLLGRSSVPGDLSERELRRAFSEGAGLIYTNLGWQPPTNVFAGPAIFRDRGAFVPQGGTTDRLWRVLQVRRPSLEDCIRVVGQLARKQAPPDGNDLVVLLETLRFIRDLLDVAEPSRNVRRRLTSLPLWTSQGWVADRPVFAVADPSLVAGLEDKVPVWEPGGEVIQFVSLLEPLRITLLTADHAAVAHPESAVSDVDATELFSLAVAHLQEDMARNAPSQAAALTIGWVRLNDFEVKMDPDLRVAVNGVGRRRPIEVEVSAKADPNAGVLFLKAPHRMRQVDGGGSAIANLFSEADRRQVAQAWLAACVAAEDGRQARRVELAAQQAAEDQTRREREMAERTAALGGEIKNRHGKGSKGPPPRPKKPPAGTPKPAKPTPPPPKPRVLVDPSRMGLVDPNGASGEPAGGGKGGGGKGGGGSKRDGGSLPDPNRKARPPKSRTPSPGFTANDKEAVGLELARIVLGGDSADIVDIRAQHNVGADAIDKLDRYFELKVHLGDEPDTIRMEDSQIRRALSTPDFFLVVVSNVEGSNAKPKVRIIVDPVNQLRMAETSAVSFSGVRSAEHSLTYTLEPIAESDGEPDPAADQPTNP